MAQIRLGRYEAEEGELPPLCLRCGAPATLFKAKLLSWQPPWTYIVFGLTFWPLLALTAILRKRMRLLAPFCAAHRNHWQRRRLLSWSVISGLLILFLLGILLAIRLELENIRVPSPFLLFWVAGMAITFAIELLRAGSIRPIEISDEAMTLTNVAEAFVAQWRLERAAAVQRSGGDVRVLKPR
jgi:hypothetical protein